MNVYRSASHESWEVDLSMHKVVTKHDSRTMSPIALYIIVANYFVSYGNQDHNWCFNIDKYLLIQIIYYRSKISVISTVFEIRQHRVQKDALWNLIFVTTGSMCEQMDISEGRYIFQLKIW